MMVKQTFDFYVGFDIINHNNQTLMDRHSVVFECLKTPMTHPWGRGRQNLIHAHKSVELMMVKQTFDFYVRFDIINHHNQILMDRHSGVFEGLKIPLISQLTYTDMVGDSQQDDSTATCF